MKALILFAVFLILNACLSSAEAHRRKKTRSSHISEGNGEPSKSKPNESQKAVEKQVKKKASGKSKAANHLSTASCSHGPQFPLVHRLSPCSHVVHGSPQSPPGSTNHCPSHVCSYRRSRIGPKFHFVAHLLTNLPKKQHCKSSTSGPPATIAMTTASTDSGSKNTDANSISPPSTFLPKTSTNAVETEIISTTKNDTTPTVAAHSTPFASNNNTSSATSNKTPTAVLNMSTTATGKNTLNVTNVSSPAMGGNAAVS